jgi:hypothetical protein
MRAPTIRREFAVKRRGGFNIRPKICGATPFVGVDTHIDPLPQFYA